MSSQHTQGRLVVRNLWLVPEAHSERIIGGCTDPERDFEDYAHHIGSVEGKRNYHNNEANARRLAACWNYFDSSLSTEFIENDSFAKMQESFVLQRAEIQKLSANLGYYQSAMYYPDVPLYQVEHGGVVPEVTPMRVSAIVEELAAARALLQKEMQAHEDNNRFESADRIRSFLEGK